MSDENPTTSFMQANERLEDEARARHAPKPGTLSRGELLYRLEYAAGTRVVYQNDGAIAIRCVRVHPDAKLPTYATDGSAGMDLYAAQDVSEPVGTSTAVDIGVVLEIPNGYCGLILQRSGLGRKGVLSMTGVIDCDYRGPLGGTLVKLQGTGPLLVRTGDRIAQLVIMPVPRVELVEVESVEMLSKTERSDKGFGSSGK